MEARSRTGDAPFVFLQPVSFPEARIRATTARCAASSSRPSCSRPPVPATRARSRSRGSSSPRSSSAARSSLPPPRREAPRFPTCPPTSRSMRAARCARSTSRAAALTRRPSSATWSRANTNRRRKTGGPWPLAAPPCMGGTGSSSRSPGLARGDERVGIAPVRGADLAQLLQVLGRQLQLGGGQVLLELRHGACSDYQARDLRLGEEPRERHGRRADPVVLRHPLHRIERVPVLLRGAGRPGVLPGRQPRPLRRRLVALVLAAQEPARERAPRQDAQAELARGGHQLALRVADGEAPLDLHRLVARAAQPVRG